MLFHPAVIKTGESGLTVFRLLTKDNRWKWVQANARLVYKNGKPDYIIATQRPLGEEEGSEHLRKRSMHLPFTFATGEALLYQTSYPVPGIPNNMNTKGKGGRAKKGKGDKGSKDTLDPSSLLGAMMRQDKSVYVCQPAVEPKLAFHSSLFSEHGHPGTASATGDTWDSDTITGGSKPELPSFDPLLATLDSLSLEGEDSCSNSELFDALENLGLNAEDLELLLLDERMIQVEMEPGYIPSLNDLLTNNEILSYIHDSLENQTVDATCNGDSQGPDVLDPIQGPSEPYVHLLDPCPSTEPNPTDLSSTYVPYHLTRQPPPILQLPQQMQQHLSSQSLRNKCHSWIPEPQGGKISVVSLPQGSPVLINEVTGVHNGHWVPGVSLDNPTEDNSKLPETSKQQRHHWHDGQLQSQCPYKQKASHEGGPHNGVYDAIQWQGYNFADQADPSAGGLCPENSHVDYHTAAGSGVEFTMNSNPAGDICQFQGVVATSSSYQQLYPKQQQPKAPPTYFSYTNQNSSLEHILVLPPPQELPSLDAYEIFDSASPHDPTHGKMENGCVLNSTSVAYPGNGLLPNGTMAAAPSNSPHPRPEPLPAIPDPQTTGFYL
ncbi:hypothetical protein NFI96_007091 [Prochilodus magdalenae]|nr:hypothetical protein NFI96_007091 [Prochilodus magdalenae]